MCQAVNVNPHVPDTQQGLLKCKCYKKQQHKINVLQLEYIFMHVMCTKKKKRRRKQAGIGANFETAQNIIFAKVVAVH